MTRPMPNFFVTAKLDSGASKHYIRPEDSKCLTNITNVPATFVGFPDKKVIEITKQGDLTLSKALGHEAQTGHILNDLKSATLLSAGQFCDDNCTVILNKKKAIIQKDNRTILQGPRNKRDGL